MASHSSLYHLFLNATVPPHKATRKPSPFSISRRKFTGGDRDTAYRETTASCMEKKQLAKFLSLRRINVMRSNDRPKCVLVTQIRSICSRSNKYKIEIAMIMKTTSHFSSPPLTAAPPHSPASSTPLPSSPLIRLTSSTPTVQEICTIFSLDDMSPSSASLTYAYGGEDRAALVRNALRNRERDSSEEKWVCYSEVVKEEEVTSSAVDRAAEIRRPSLKLDYQEILNVWSNKGPLYIDSESSQIVPDVNNNDDDFQSHEGSNNGTMSWGCNAGEWTVPKMEGEIENGETRTKREEDLKLGQREASVLRYKEKRWNRLFSRTIRYQVRKRNVEKRPRVKGRFVKRN